MTPLKAIGLIVKRAGEAAGLDPWKLGGHSLRRGFAQVAAEREIPTHLIQGRRWRSLAGLQEYLGTGRGWKDAVTQRLGL